jgi:3-oxosteroid 1-dehydrogenase
MSSAWRSQVVLEEALENRLLGQGAFFLPGDSMFLVNKYGVRVVNEKRNYNDRTKVHFTYDPVREDYPNQVLFMIFDERTRDAYGGAYPLTVPGEPSPYFITGASLSELSRNIAARLARVANAVGGATLAPDFDRKLQQTVARFNGFARAGRDEDFGRGAQAYDREWQAFFSAVREGSTFPRNSMPNGTMHPLRDSGPYYAIMLSAGALDTNGGPLIDAHARVLGADLQPIPGLYGAGNCIASPSREAYYGAGGTIGLAMTFGYIAALDATASA